MGSSERPAGAEPRRRTPLMASFAGLIFLAGSLLLAFVPPHRLRVPRSLGSPERRRMLDAWDAAQASARTEWTDDTMHFHPDTASPLPLMERLRRHYDVSGHDHHHPQGDNYETLPRADGRRGLQASDGGLLTEETTSPLEILVDTSNLFEDRAMEYTTCFRVGQWFKWNFPATSSPPCATATVASGRDTYDGWVAGDQNGCPGTAADVYAPGNLDGVMCNRQYDSSSQNCWGVCLEEDTLVTADQDPCAGVSASERATSGCEDICDASEGGDPTLCNMRDWAIKHINQVVAETEGYLRSRTRASNLRLEDSRGIYNHIYLENGIAEETACARDAKLLYRVPVLDEYCTTGFSADVIFYPVMTQYTPGVGGWGGDAGKDEMGRPVLLVMGWSIGTTPLVRLRKEQADSPRGLILHEIVHGLGFSVYNFRDRRDGDGNRDSMVEERDVPDDSEDVWFVTSQRTLAVARDYFGCPTLDGLPLMGDNQLGSGSRGSHWETRVMNDEFMAYGDGSMVSGMTIAMLEDLGFYLGNYDNAQCMSWGKKQGCAFVTSRCGERKPFVPAEAEITLSPGEGCNKHWKSGSGVGNGADIVDDLGGWNNGVLTPSGSCTSSPSNPIIARYCVASNCRRQWPGMVASSDNGGKPEWACVGFSSIDYEGQQYVCGDGQSCKCSAECQTYDPATADPGTGSLGTLWGTEVGASACAQPTGPVHSATARSRGNPFANPLENYPGIIVTVVLFILVAISCKIWHCIKTSSHHHLMMASVLIFVIFIVLSVALLIATLYARFAFDDLDAIVSNNAWTYAICFSGGILGFSVYGAFSVVCVARKQGCLGSCQKWPIAIFCLLLFALIVVQTLGTAVVFFWVKDSYSFSEGEYSTIGQLEGDTDRTRTGWGLFDETLDKSIREIEAVTCNSYKKCCYTIAATEPASEPEEEGSSVTLSAGGTLSTNGTAVGDEVQSTQRLSAGDTTRTCVGGHTGSTVGAAANILRDPSHPQFCQLLSSSNRAGITPTGALCYAMEEFGVLSGMAANGTGDLGTCQDDFCDAGVDGYEKYVSGIFGWVHDKAVSLGIAVGVLGFLEAAQFLCCTALLLWVKHDDLAEAHGKAMASLSPRRRAQLEAASRQQAGFADDDEDGDWPPPPPKQSVQL